jgi:MFS family permease
VTRPTELAERQALLLAAGLRSIATGMAGVLLGVYLAKLGLEPRFVGLVAGAGLAGSAAGALAVTLRGERWPRRRALLLFGLLAAGGGLCFALASQPAALAAAAFVGMVNAMGRDRGPLHVLEQAALAAAAEPGRRTAAFAWYTALQDVGHAVGSLAAGLPAWLAASGLTASELGAFRLAIGAQAALAGVSALAYLRLTPEPAPEPEPAADSRRPARLTPESRRIVGRISLLFGLDGLGGGLLTTALVSYFFFARFGVDVATLGALFFAGRLANVLSHFGAAWLAARIGLVNTMVWTHLPSSLLLAGAALAPEFRLAALLFVMREALVEMDVPTRQSYVMAVVRPAERVTAAGVTNLVRLGAWAAGPALAGGMMGALGLAAPLLAGAGLKIAYDLLLYGAFRRVRPPEEAARPGP